MARIDYHLVCRALLEEPTECGDMGFVKEFDNMCFLALVDVLGHGREAHKVACLAETFLEDNFRKDPVDVMKGLHNHLKGTRGAVAALCRLNIDTGEIIYTGTGNITTRVMGPRAFSFVPRDGVIGYMIPTPHAQQRRLYPGDILLLHSDGIREHFDPLECSAIFSGTAETISTGLFERFRKKDDDSSCLALRYLA